MNKLWFLVIPFALIVFTLFAVPTGYLAGFRTAEPAASSLPGITLPPGFQITLFAENVTGARSMTLSSSGTLFVGTRGLGNLYAIKDTNNDWIASHYAQSGQIWVTPDSVSMVYEALSSGAVTKVFYLSPSSTASRVRNGVDELIQNKALQPFDLWKNDSTIEHSSCYFNEAERIAEHIKEHLL